MTGLQEIDLKSSYDSDEDDVVNNFLLPVLSTATSYKRLAGYFSSSSLAIVGRGIKELLKNGGTMQLVCGCEFSQKDREAIESGSEATELSASFAEEINALTDDDFRKKHAQILGWMIKNKKLEIKIADIPLSNTGIFHMKIGVIANGSDTISFTGSINETANAYLHSTENFDVHRSWEQGQAEYVVNHENTFEKYWNNSGINTKVYSLPTAIENKLLQIAPTNYEDVEIEYPTGQSTSGFELWPHQAEAIENWENNNHRGIWDIATAGGKTYTAIMAAEKAPKSVITIVTVPKKILQAQWCDDIKEHVPGSQIIRVGGNSDPNWENELQAHITSRRLLDQTKKDRIAKRVYVVAVEGTATKDRFLSLWSNTDPSDVQFIADEVHNLGTTGGQKLFKLPCERRIGLSATYVRQWDPVGTQAIENFFGGVVFTYKISEGIDDRRLCHYEVHHYDVEFTDTEYNYYHTLTREIGKYIILAERARRNRDQQQVEAYRLKQKEKSEERAEIIKTAENKMVAFEQIVKQMPHDEKTIVFCEDSAQLKQCIEILERNSKKSRYFATVLGQTKQEQDDSLQHFEDGTARWLVGIGCLDEGVDIKSCTGCILVSSSGTEREYVQRRGRILRKLGVDKIAHLYDLITYPPALTPAEIAAHDTTINALLGHELRRSDIIWEAADNRTTIETHMGTKFAQFGKTLTQIRGRNRP